MAGHAANSVIELLDHFNLMAGDYQAGNETEGSAFIWGEYHATGSSRFGFNGGQVADDSEYVLWLGNGVSTTSTTTLITGSVVSRVSVNSSLFNLNGNGAGDPVLAEGQDAWDDALVSDLGLNSTDEIVAILGDASSQWATLEANSVATLPGNGGLSFSATPADIDGYQVAVFNVTAEQLMDGSISRFDLALNGADTVLVNVSGGDVTLSKSFTGDFVNNESSVLFNFYEAETVSVDVNVRGGIYAPFATVDQNGSNIDGTVVAAEFDQTAEVHDERFDGYLPYDMIPEPASTVLVMLGGMVLLRRRR